MRQDFRILIVTGIQPWIVIWTTGLVVTFYTTVVSFVYLYLMHKYAAQALRNLINDTLPIEAFKMGINKCDFM